MLMAGAMRVPAAAVTVLRPLRCPLSVLQQPGGRPLAGGHRLCDGQQQLDDRTLLRAGRRIYWACARLVLCIGVSARLHPVRALGSQQHCCA